MSKFLEGTLVGAAAMAMVVLYAVVVAVATVAMLLVWGGIVELIT